MPGGAQYVVPWGGSWSLIDSWGVSLFVGGVDSSIRFFLSASRLVLTSRVPSPNSSSSSQHWSGMTGDCPGVGRCESWRPLWWLCARGYWGEVLGGRLRCSGPLERVRGSLGHALFEFLCVCHIMAVSWGAGTTPSLGFRLRSGVLCPDWPRPGRRLTCGKVSSVRVGQCVLCCCLLAAGRML